MKIILWNVFSQFLGKVLTVLAAFFIVKIVSGYGTNFYGNYVTSYEFLAFFGTLADMGLFAIAVKGIIQSDVKKKRDDLKTSLVSHDTDSIDPKSSVISSQFILGNILTMRIVLVLSMTLLAGFIAQWIPLYNHWVKMGIWITGLSMTLTIIAGTLSSVLQARMKIHFFSFSLVLTKLLLAAFVFFLARNFSQNDPKTLFFYFLWAGVLSNALFCFLVYFFAQKEISIRLYFNFNYWWQTIQNAFAYGMALVLQTLYLRLDLVLISLILGAESIGVYGVSARVMESFLILGVFFGQSMLPKFSSELNTQDEASKTLVWGLETLLIFSLPIVMGVYFFAADIVLLLSNTEYLSQGNFFGADKALVLLVPAVIFSYFNQLFSFALVSKNRQSYLLIVNGLGLFSNLGLNLLFLKKFGLLAAALSTVFCELLVFILLCFFVRRYFSFPFNYHKLTKIFLLNFGLFGLISLTSLEKNLTMALVVCSFIYFGVLWTLRREFIDS